MLGDSYNVQISFDVEKHRSWLYHTVANLQTEDLIVLADIANHQIAIRALQAKKNNLYQPGSD